MVSTTEVLVCRLVSGLLVVYQKW